MTTDTLIERCNLGGRSATFKFKDGYFLEVTAHTSSRITTGIERVVLNRNKQKKVAEITGTNDFSSTSAIYTYNCLEGEISQQEMGERLEAAGRYCVQHELNSALQIVTADDKLSEYLMKNIVPIQEPIPASLKEVA